MKKLLLFAASLVLAIGANAQKPTEPAIFENMLLSATSSNGQYVAGGNPFTLEVNIVDLATGETQTYSDEFGEEEYSIGMGGNSISDNGITLICTSYVGTAAYVENGEIKFLPLPEGTQSAYCNAITPDGSRIAGNIGLGMSLDYEGTMQCPVVWNRNADGTYSDPIALPYPKDPTGLAPQYILVDGISADGTVLACQMTDHSGWQTLPLVIIEHEGEWSYKLLGTEFLNQDGIEIPENPGEAPDPMDYMTEEEKAAYLAAKEEAANAVQPEQNDFMSPESYEAFMAAWDLYMEDPFNNPFPNPDDFMTEEELDAYYTALNEYFEKMNLSALDFLSEEGAAAYMADYEVWNEKNEAFQEAYWAAMENSVEFIMNQFFISANGRYYVIGGKKVDKETWEETNGAYIFDLDTGLSLVKSFGTDMALPTFISNDGRILASTSMQAIYLGLPTNTYITESLEGDVVLFQDYVRKTDPELYGWMEQNMLHQTLVWDDELEEEVLEERWIVGVPSCSKDMDLFTTWTLNSWDYETDAFMFSYVLPLKNVTAIKNLQPETALEVTMSADGILNVKGQAAVVNVYDMSGNIVFTAKNVSGSVDTGLGRGAYVVKASNAKKNVAKISCR